MRGETNPSSDSESQVEERRVWGVGAGIDELEQRLWVADRLRHEEVRTIRASRPTAAPYRLVRPERARLPTAPAFGRPQDLHHERDVPPRRASEPAHPATCRVADDDRA